MTFTAQNVQRICWRGYEHAFLNQMSLPPLHTYMWSLYQHHSISWPSFVKAVCAMCRGGWYEDTLRDSFTPCNLLGVIKVLLCFINSLHNIHRRCIYYHQLIVLLPKMSNTIHQRNQIQLPVQTAGRYVLHTLRTSIHTPTERAIHNVSKLHNYGTQIIHSEYFEENILNKTSCIPTPLTTQGKHIYLSFKLCRTPNALYMNFTKDQSQYKNPVTANIHVTSLIK
jgi:hypothetical protein